MRVASILSTKGSGVETVAPETEVEWVVRRLVSMQIGALVVSEDGERVLGVISERDIIRGLYKHGDTVMSMPVRQLMSKKVLACTPEDTIRRVMADMTRFRTRHMPVLDGGKLCGIVSLGDVVKYRLDEIELENSILRESNAAPR
jgi:CBS domain-containing protein